MIRPGQLFPATLTNVPNVLSSVTWIPLIYRTSTKSSPEKAVSEKAVQPFNLK
jgi:hypothetical protein